jgi:hypothetical protein
MNYISLAIVAFIGFIMSSCSDTVKQDSPFVLTVSDQGVNVSENGKPVLFYQKQPKSLTGKYICNNYIHPLYNLKGDILTEEFPEDHPYHRGIFWAWHQLYADNKRVGDGWVNDSISQEVVNLRTLKGKDKAQLFADVLWSSSAYSDGKPFIEEKSVITINKLDDGLRKIDFEISLTALVKGVQLGGSSDAKGYGGFCARLNLSDSLVFTSDQGRVIPLELQIKAGQWMDFSGRFGSDSTISGMAILCHPTVPGPPGQWILRQKTSMQNAVFPGRERIDLAVDKPVTLRYRLVIHDGSAQSLVIGDLLKEYDGMYGK